MNNKRLHRSKTDRMVGGVCAGLGSYAGIDPLIVRVIFVGLALANGVGIMAYLLLWIMLPEVGSEYPNQEEMIKRNMQEIGQRLQAMAQRAGDGLSGQGRGLWQGRSRSQTMLVGLVILGLGVLILLNNSGILRWVRFDILWPALLIVAGIALLANTLRSRH